MTSHDHASFDCVRTWIIPLVPETSPTWRGRGMRCRRSGGTGAQAEASRGSGSDPVQPINGWGSKSHEQHLHLCLHS